MRDTSILEGALALARGGIPVISLRPRSKVPLHARWPDLGLLDEEAIRQEWRLNPDSNVGVLCGHDAFDGYGLTIIDLDEPDGIVNWNKLSDEAMLDYATVSTPGGGTHAYFQGFTESWNPLPCVEVRSIGRQCVAPPSVVGTPYTWWTGFPNNLGHLPPLPAWAVKSDGVYKAGRWPAFRPGPRGLRDPVLEVPPPVYFRELCGLEPGRDGFVCCPLHNEIEPSLKVYETADRGWFCYGESCRRGGDVITLVAELAGIPTPVRGQQFVALLDYLRGRLL